MIVPGGRGRGQLLDRAWDWLSSQILPDPLADLDLSDLEP